jgi:ComF family protein
MSATARPRKDALSTARRLLGAAAHALLDWFYPRHCVHCESPIEEPGALILCRRCYGDLLAVRMDGDLCSVCGAPTAGRDETETMCLDCRLEERNFDLARAFFRYAGPAASIIKSYKFRGDLWIGPRLLNACLREGWLPEEIGRPGAVLPVPLHPRRRRERGYDQALLLSRAAARHFDAELLGGALRRTRNTSQQAQLPVTRRWDNVRGAFAVGKPDAVEGRDLLLVDDVMTTGMTADACAKVLKKSGARRVEVLTLARTVV